MSRLWIIYIWKRSLNFHNKMTTVDDRKVKESEWTLRFGTDAADCTSLVSVVFTLRSVVLWDSAIDWRFPQRHFLCNEIGKYDFVNSNCIFIWLLQPKITIWLHGFFRKIYVSSQFFYRHQEFYGHFISFLDTRYYVTTVCHLRELVTYRLMEWDGQELQFVRWW
jgi:hypothetical protein